MQEANENYTDAGGGVGPALDDNQAGVYIDQYNKGRQLSKDVGDAPDEGIHYGQHPAPTTKPAAPAPPVVRVAPPYVKPTPPVVAAPLHVNTPAQNAALHKHTIMGEEN